MSRLATILNKIVDLVTDNEIGATVEITSYTSTFYTVPSDGYVTASCTGQSASKMIAQVVGNTTANYPVQFGGWGNGTYGSWSMFVRKGMRVKVITVENGGKLYFRPLGG